MFTNQYYTAHEQEHGMIRRLITFIILCTFLSISHAQSLDELYASLISEKREQISHYLDLQDNSAFWEVYDKYEQKQAEYDSDAYKLIKKFNDKNESGEIELQSIINMQAEFFRIEGRILQNKQNYAEFFAKTISKQDVFRLYQIDAKFDAMIRSKIAKDMPLIAPKATLD